MIEELGTAVPKNKQTRVVGIQGTFLFLLLATAHMHANNLYITYLYVL